MKDKVQNLIVNSHLAQSRYIIAIDGLSSCGKSTLAKDLAHELGYTFVDSGAMYRAVSLYFLNNNIPIELEKDYSDILEKNVRIHFQNVEGINTTFLNDRNIESEIRRPGISAIVSDVASNSSVRRFLVDQQRKMGEKDGVIMDGRDIGTIVFPNANFKLFVTADIDERAERRYKELKNRNIDITKEIVKENLASRDHKDSTRSDSPLKKAEDALVLDTTHHTRESQLLEAIEQLLSHTKL